MLLTVTLLLHRSTEGLCAVLKRDDILLFLFRACHLAIKIPYFCYLLGAHIGMENRKTMHAIVSCAT